MKFLKGFRGGSTERVYKKETVFVLAFRQRTDEKPSAKTTNNQRTKKKGRACVSHSIESYKCAERTGDPALLFRSWSNGSFRHVESLNWIVQMCRDVGTWTNRLCVNLALVRTKWLEAEKRLGFVEPLNWLERWCRNKGSLGVFPLKRIDRCHTFRGVFCPVLSGQWGLCASFVLAFFYLCSSIVLSYF